MPLGDTIAAISSAPGCCARAIIRVSGPGAHALPIVEVSTSPSSDSRAAIARVRLSESLALPVLVLRFFAPRSSTGEDTLEILLPGNPALVDRVLAAILRAPGVRAATPGEFTARAFLDGRLTLDQAEGVAATIAAQNESELAAARDLLSGVAGSRARAWVDELATLLALVEAGIDFTDQEDVVPISPRDLSARVRALLASIESTIGSRAGAESRTEHPRVVLAGAPNAGKSTLFNALLNRPRAVVSLIPGTTRDALEEPLTLDAPGSQPVTLVDLAGLDDALAEASASPSDRAAQARARDTIAGADALLWCDPRGTFADPAIDAISRSKPTIRVRTKADLPISHAHATPDPAIVPVCGLDGYNLALLRRAIADAALGSRGARVIPRHARAMADASRALRAALESFDSSQRALADPASVASSLREALDALGELTGRLTPDDIIGRIFATFCIGK
jgi:tRNA modification GTPase